VEVERLESDRFGGDLVLPLREIDGRHIPDEYRIWSLADGSEIRTPVYYGTARFGSLPDLYLDIAAWGDETIVGRA
jgi:hypothetical protein